MQNTWLGKVFLFRGQSWTFSQKSPFTHDGKTKSVTPGKVENHQQDLKLLFNTSKNQLNREPALPYEYGGLT